MQPKIEKVYKKDNESFLVAGYRNKWFERSWHFHNEYELLLVTKGTGTRIVGNTSSKFSEGDFVLLSGNIPHAWYSDPIFFESNSDKFCESIYVHFDRSIFGTKFAGLPEMNGIQHLLNDAQYGVKFKESTCCDLMEQLKMLQSYRGLQRLVHLISILEELQQTNYSKILSQSYLKNQFALKSDRIKKVHEYVMNNYMHDIKVQNAAELVQMNVSSFCRFFKKMTTKTFSQYVKETRIDYAQQLLINTNLASNQIGFECGFSSIAYFNQCFKNICTVSPLKYRSIYKVI